MPPEIEALINQLNRELHELEAEANQGVELTQRFLRQFPDNPFLIKCFAKFNNYLFFASSMKRQVEVIAKILRVKSISTTALQENGEYLSSILGRVYEAKNALDQLKRELENPT